MKKIIMMVLVLCMGLGLVGCNKDSYTMDDINFDLLSKNIKKDDLNKMNSKVDGNFSEDVLTSTLDIIDTLNMLKQDEYDMKQVTKNIEKILLSANKILASGNYDAHKYATAISDICLSIAYSKDIEVSDPNQIDAKISIINNNIDTVGSWFKNGDKIVGDFKMSSDEYIKLIKEFDKIQK